MGKLKPLELQINLSFRVESVVVVYFVVGVFLLISDAAREQAWIDWLSNEENGVVEHKDQVMTYLQAIANSFSEDTLNTAARELEESDVWKLSDKMRNWFQLHWLAQAKVLFSATFMADIDPH